MDSHAFLETHNLEYARPNARASTGITNYGIRLSYTLIKHSLQSSIHNMYYGHVPKLGSFTKGC
jgi:hypothetical protein